MVVRWVEVLFLRDGVAGQILELLVIFAGSYLAGSWVFWYVEDRWWLLTPFFFWVVREAWNEVGL